MHLVWLQGGYQGHSYIRTIEFIDYPDYFTHNERTTNSLVIIMSTDSWTPPPPGSLAGIEIPATDLGRAKVSLRGDSEGFDTARD